MRHARLLPQAFLTVLLGTITVITTAQTDRCPAIVQAALEQVDTVCEALGRNQLCYGNTLSEARDMAGDSLPFEAAGDIVELEAVNTLTTYPLNEDADTWGLAVMSVQADLPDTSPGQNVTFIVFGDTQVEAVENAAITVDATAPSNINLRTGPGTGFATAGLLEAGSTATLIARNEVGDWGRVANDDNAPIWIFMPLLETSGDTSVLPVVELDENVVAGYDAPMQAFRFTSGIGRPACEEAPRDGVVIQTPTGLTANFLINGVQMSVGSTALVRLTDDEGLRVATLDGNVAINTAGEQTDLGTGQGIIITDGTENPVVEAGYDRRDIQGLQDIVNVLPEPFEIGFETWIFPAFGTEEDGTCRRFNWSGLNAPNVSIADDIRTNEPIRIQVGSAGETLEEVDWENSRFEITFNGERIPVTEVIEPYIYEQDGRWVGRNLYVIDNPGPGEYELSARYVLPASDIDAVLTCTVNVIEADY